MPKEPAIKLGEAVQGRLLKSWSGFVKKTKKNKSESEINQRRHPVNQSVLYKLKGIGQLEKVLNCSKSSLDKLSEDSNYYYHEPKKNNGKKRSCWVPKLRLRKVHEKLTYLLNKITIPSYLHSGTKKRSYKSNALEHANHHQVLKLDLEKYFPSCSKKSVFWFFYNELKMAKDIAGLLAGICTHNNCIPTGSPLSMILSYFTSKRMFDKLNALCERKEIIMTVYVDDITFSGKAINGNFKNEIINFIKKSGFKVKNKKTRLYDACQPKLITGVIIKGAKPFLRNKQHKKIYELRKKLSQETSEINKGKIKMQLNGHLSAASQIDKTFAGFISKN